MFHYVHILPKYRPQPDISLPPNDDPNILACCLLSEKLTRFDFGEFPYHTLVMNILTILNVPNSRKPVDVYQVSAEARQFPHLCLSTGQETSDSGTCG
jgi:hypothetical protein